MKRTLAAILALTVASAALAQSKPAPAQSNPYKALDEAIAEVARMVGATEDCLRTLQELKSDLSAKEASLKAEFKGRIPDAFHGLLEMKRNRLSTHSARCFKLHTATGESCDKAHRTMRSIEPQSLGGIAERGRKLAQYRSRNNQLSSRFRGN